jgi:hypothetical protein
MINLIVLDINKRVLAIKAERVSGITSVKKAKIGEIVSCKIHKHHNLRTS